MYLLIECAKLKISEMDFHDSFLMLGLSAEVNQELLTLYKENQEEVRQILDRMYPGLPAYVDMHWRLDVQIASRSLRQQTEPNIVFKIDLEGAESVVLQTDPATLQHLASELDAALKETKTSHYRCVARDHRCGACSRWPAHGTSLTFCHLGLPSMSIFAPRRVTRGIRA